MKKTIKYLVVFLALFVYGQLAQAQKKEVDLYFFYGQGCPHCAKEEIFLDQLESQNQNLNIHRYEVWYDRDNANLLKRVIDELKISVGGVPATIVGRGSIIGYFDDASTGREIKELIDNNREGDIVGRIIEGEKAPPPAQKEASLPDKTPAGDGQTIKSKLFGEINLKTLSLPLLTITIGSLDSLNPCAMWVLLFLISLLFGMENRSKMWLLGSTFIVASAVAYFIFLAAWLNIFLFIGYVSWLRLAIAIFAVASGFFYLKKYWIDRKGGCEIEASGERRKKIIGRLKEIASDSRLLFAILGIAALASSINLVELLCSAGLPAVYVPILTLAGLARWKYYLYLLLYVFFYILPQLVIFLIAMFSLRLTAISSRITKYSNLIGGLIMLALGLLLLFKPGWIMFG